MNNYAEIVNVISYKYVDPSIEICFYLNNVFNKNELRKYIKHLYTLPQNFPVIKTKLLKLSEKQLKLNMKFHNKINHFIYQNGGEMCNKSVIFNFSELDKFD